MKLNEYLPEGASYELRSMRTQTTNVQFAGNRFERIESADRISETVRLQHLGKLSTASGSKPGGSAELLRQAVEMAPYGSPYTVPFVAEADVPDLHLADDGTMTSQQMMDMISAFVDDLRGVDSRVTVNARLGSTISEVSLQTSLGFDHSFRKTVWSCGAGFELVQKDDRLRLNESQTSMGPHLDLKLIKEELTKKLGYAKNVVPFSSGAYPVIFAPRQVGNIINPVLQSLNGLAVFRRTSPWGDKLGQELLDPRFTLIDDGSLEGAYTSQPFDAEGTPTRRNALVENGRLGDLLLDRKTAALLGKESTGNAGGMAPTPHHLCLSAGSKTLEELIRSIDCGLVIYDTMGAWSGNPFAGIVTGTISMGLKIEKGEIVGRVKDCMFTVNAFEHLRRHLIDLSSEAKPAMNHLFPYLLLDEVVISTK